MSPPIDMVELWVERLRIGSPPQRARAASFLSRLQIAARGSAKPRGDLSRPAASAFPKDISDNAISAALAGLTDETAAVRREVAFSLGQWGDDRSVAILGRLLLGPHRDPEVEVRRAAIAALGTIGGANAVAILSSVTEDRQDTPETIRQEALMSLFALAKTGPDLYINPADEFERGAVRASLSAMADRLQFDPGNSDDIKNAAGALAKVLTR